MIQQGQKMATYLVTFVLALLAITTSRINASHQENVPLLAWSNSESLASVKSLAAVPLSSSLKEMVYSREKIIVFVQNKMSFGDLAKYGGLYSGESGSLKSIEQLIGDSASSATLSIPHQLYLIELLVKELSFLHTMNEAVFFTAEEIQSSDVQFVNSKCKLCVITLPEPSSSVSSERASQLTKAGKFVVMVMNKNVVKEGKYIAMLAAKSSQEHHSDKVVLTRMTRSAIQYRQVDTSNGTCANESSIHYCKNVSGSAEEERCFFNMRFNSISVRLQDNFTETGHNTYLVDFNSSQTIQPSEIVCQNISSTVWNISGFGFAVVYTGMNKSNATEDFTITFMFVKSGHALSKGFWRLDLLIESNPILEETHLTYKKELLPPYPLDIPYKASFHCSDATYCVERHPITDKCDPKQPFVTISGLQAEIFKSVTKSQFNIAYDCEPYFSATTWMGVLTLSVLLPILILGLFAVFQTQTMDRFDDPREPQLVTTVAE